MSDMISRMDAIQACQVGPSDEWSSDTKSGYYQAATDCQMNILRIRALPSVGVTVKPLEWVSVTITKEHKGLSGIWLHAWGVSGQYEVHVFDTDPGHVMLNGPDIVPTDIYDTIEAAKSAAQADYEARILAALDVQPTPAPSPDVVALRQIADLPHESLLWRDIALAALARKGR